MTIFNGYLQSKKTMVVSGVISGCGDQLRRRAKSQRGRPEYLPGPAGDDAGHWCLGDGSWGWCTGAPVTKIEEKHPQDLIALDPHFPSPNG